MCVRVCVLLCSQLALLAGYVSVGCESRGLFFGFQSTAALTQGLDRIPDQLGYLVISEEGVLAVSTHPRRYMSWYWYWY